MSFEVDTFYPNGWPPPCLFCLFVGFFFLARTAISHLGSANSRIAVIHWIFTFSIFFPMPLLSKGKNSIIFCSPSVQPSVSVFFMLHDNSFSLSDPPLWYLS